MIRFSNCVIVHNSLNTHCFVCIDIKCKDSIFNSNSSSTLGNINIEVQNDYVVLEDFFGRLHY